MKNNLDLMLCPDQKGGAQFVWQTNQSLSNDTEWNNHPFAMKNVCLGHVLWSKWMMAECAFANKLPSAVWKSTITFLCSHSALVASDVSFHHSPEQCFYCGEALKPRYMTACAGLKLGPSKCLWISKSAETSQHVRNGLGVRADSWVRQCNVICTEATSNNWELG